MAINFPSSPTNGQIFSPIAGLYYVYNLSATTWEATTNPITALPFNYLINPSFDVSQENGDSVVTAVSSYPADMWHIQHSGVAGANVQRLTSLTTAGSKYRLKVTFTSAVTMTGAQYFGFVQYLEGNRIAAFEFGTPRAKPAILRFWVKGPAGTYGGGIRNGTANRGFSYTFTISSGEANTLVERSFAIPGDITATWVYGNAIGMAVWITFVNSFTSLATTPGTWVASNIIAPSASINGASVANNVFEIADIGLYLDPYNTGAAPHYEAVTEHVALTDSQRYWWPCRDLLGASTATLGPARGRALCPTPMRTIPGVTVVGTAQAYDVGATNSITAIANNYTLNNYVIECNCTASAAYTVGRANMQLTTSTGYLAVSARM